MHFHSRKGMKIEVLPPSSWRQARLHRSLALNCSNPPQYKKSTPSEDRAGRYRRIRSPAGEPRRLRVSTGHSLRAAFRIRPKRQKPEDLLVFGFLWWGRTDSNHRSDTQQIYSLSPLATRELPHINFGSIGAGRRTRTPDLLITNQLLYQLSYTGVSNRTRLL